MKFIELTRGKRVKVDDADYEWLSQWKWYFHTCHYGGYAARGVRSIKLPKGYKNIMMHRLINNTPDGFETDHINGDKLDNRRSNLRTVTRAENRYNMGLRADNKSGMRGVSWLEQRNVWVASGVVNNKWSTLGYYKNLDDAVKSRLEHEHQIGKQQNAKS